MTKNVKNGKSLFKKLKKEGQTLTFPRGCVNIKYVKF